MAVEQKAGNTRSTTLSTYVIISLSAVAAALAVIYIMSGNRVSKTPVTESLSGEDAGRISDLKAALAEAPMDPALNLEMGNQFFDLGKYSESVVYYRRVLETDPAHVAARIDLGVCYFNLGLADSALIEMKRSLEIEPDHVKGLFNIGVIYYNMGEKDQAREYWEQLIRRHGDSDEAHVARQMLENIKS